MKLFISHSHIDNDIAEAMVDLLINGIGLNQTSLFCSSVDGKGVPLGLNFNDYIIKQLQGDEAEVLAIISNNYYNSKYSLYELGAAWGLCRNIIPILIPPMQFANLRDFISSNVSLQATLEKDLNKLKDHLKEKYQTIAITTNVWEKNRGIFVEKIKLFSTKEKKLSIKSNQLDIKTNYRYKAVAFDFDGTILQGKEFDYSWKEVWSHLKYDDQIRKDLYWRHRDKSKSYSYEEWCADCERYFIERRLNKTHIKEIIRNRNLKPANGLLTTLKGLKKHGIKTAIISGGINTFFEYGLDDNFKSLFDKIYFNNFEYDSNGYLTKILPYQKKESDFIGKVNAFEDFCSFANCSISEAVFVGEGTNDIELAAHVSSNNGLSIAYPALSASKELKEVVKVKITDDNIAAILSEILVPILAKNNVKNYRRYSKR